MSQQIQISQEKLQEILKEYEFDTEDIFADYDDEFRDIVLAIKKLDLPERIILILYAHLQSQRKLGKILGCSHSICGKELKRIRNKLLELM